MNWKVAPKSLILLAVLFFWFANLYAAINIIISGSLDEIYHDTSLSSYSILVLAFGLVTGFYVFIYFFIASIFSLQINPSDFNGISSRKSNFISFVLVLLLVLYFYKIVSVGLGKAGGEEVEVKDLWSYIFVVFRVDYFSILFVALVGLNRFTKLILLLVFVSSLARGWLGDIVTLFILLVALLYSGSRPGNLIFSRFSLLMIMLVFSYGILMQFRENYRLGGLTQLLSSTYKVELWYVFDYVHKLLMRFQQVYSVTYYFTHYDYFEILYRNGGIRPLQYEGVINNYLYKMSGGAGEGLGYVFADHNRILIEGRKTAFTPSLIPYFYLSGGAILYSLFVMSVFYSISILLRRRHVLLLMSSYYFLVLFSFGWMGAFISFLLTYFLFLMVFLVVTNGQSGGLCK